MHFTIDYPEKVKCNSCDKVIVPKVKSRSMVYLQTISKPEPDGVVFPRCKECYDRENPTKQ